MQRERNEPTMHTPYLSNEFSCTEGGVEITMMCRVYVQSVCGEIKRKKKNGVVGIVPPVVFFNRFNAQRTYFFTARSIKGDFLLTGRHFEPITCSMYVPVCLQYSYQTIFNFHFFIYLYLLIRNCTININHDRKMYQVIKSTNPPWMKCVTLASCTS